MYPGQEAKRWYPITKELYPINNPAYPSSTINLSVSMFSPQLLQLLVPLAL